MSARREEPRWRRALSTPQMERLEYLLVCRGCLATRYGPSHNRNKMATGWDATKDPGQDETTTPTYSMYNKVLTGLTHAVGIAAAWR